MSRYLKPRDHGYLMEAAACTKVLRDLHRIEAKFARAVEKEGDARQAEFKKVMQYRNEREIQDDFGWGFITEAQYDRYLLLFQQGQAAMEQLPPTKNELAMRLVRRIIADIDRDRREWEFSALSLEDQQAELARAEQAKKAWKQKIAELKRKRGIIEASEAQEET